MTLQSTNCSTPPVSSGAGLVLGTAQLAAPYGSAVEVSPPGLEEAIQLVRKAIDYGAIAIDTARAYPGAEEVLSVALSDGWASRAKVVTKLSPLNNLPQEATHEDVANAAERSVVESLDALQCRSPWLLLHRAAHLSSWGGSVWSRLKTLKEDGKIAGLGVSVQSPEEALAAAADPDVQLIQLPFNLLDWRWRQTSVPEVLAQRSDLEVHVRSVYLQGVLLRERRLWPRIEGLEADVVVRIMRDLVKVLKRDSVADLCLAYVRGMSWLDGIVIGMERLSQLEENAELFSKQSLDDEEIRLVESALPRVPGNLLNPAKWPPLAGAPESQSR